MSLTMPLFATVTVLTDVICIGSCASGGRRVEGLGEQRPQCGAVQDSKQGEYHEKVEAGCRCQETKREQGYRRIWKPAIKEVFQ